LTDEFTVTFILLWTICIIICTQDQQTITNIKSAMRLWEDAMCLRFREYRQHTGSSDRIIFIPSEELVIIAFSYILVDLMLRNNTFLAILVILILYSLHSSATKHNFSCIQKSFFKMSVLHWTTGWAPRNTDRRIL
jgi:hypothetical protein